MSIRTPVYLFPLLLTSFISLGQRTNRLPDLADKTFKIVEEGEVSKTNDMELLLVFYQHNQAVFRAKSGRKLTDNPLRWHMEGDSLWLQTKSISMELAGKVQQIDMAPITYALIKTANGYLLKQKNEQMRLVEQK